MTFADQKRPKLALFDMDRTLVEKETASLYVRYLREIGEATTMDLARTLFWVAQYTLGLLEVEKVAERVTMSLRDTEESLLESRCRDWFKRDIEKLITAEGRRAVARHQERGDLCAIVTGASIYASRPLARTLGVDHLVATEFELVGTRFTGKPSYPLCLGFGKLERAARFAREQGALLEEAVFYTDSISDLPLLERVGEPVAVNPDPRLLRVAKQRGWRIERWLLPRTPT